MAGFWMATSRLGWSLMMARRAVKIRMFFLIASMGFILLNPL